jgi:Ca2+-binding RTX toxin-like protein
VTGAGTFGASDVVNGGAGAARDQLALRGDYALTFAAGQLISIESLLLQSGRDVRENTDYDYTITMVDANLVGGRMTVDAAQLRSSESVNFNGGAEDDGSFRIFGGAGDDTFAGSQLADSIEGRRGADTLIGNGGNDSFVYREASHSTAGAQDRILDFTLGDLIDLAGVDARAGGANDAFSFIGGNAFTNQAGQLRAVQTQTPNTWLVQGDVDGNGSADLQLLVTVSDGHQLSTADFVL